MIRTSCANHLHTVYSYYEGQLTPISENDVEGEVYTPQITVTEAAEKVLKSPFFFIWLYCSVHFFVSETISTYAISS